MRKWYNFQTSWHQSGGRVERAGSDLSRFPLERSVIQKPSLLRDTIEQLPESETA